MLILSFEQFGQVLSTFRTKNPFSQGLRFFLRISFKLFLTTKNKSYKQKTTKINGLGPNENLNPISISKPLAHSPREHRKGLDLLL